MLHETELKAKMNSMILFGLVAAIFFVYLRFSPVFLLLIRAAFFQCLTNFFLYSFSKYILCKFFAYIFAISARTHERSGRLMLV